MTNRSEKTASGETKIEWRRFRLHKDCLPTKVKGLIDREAEHSKRLQKFLKDNDIALHSLDDMGRIVRIAVSDPESRPWCRHTAKKQAKLKDGGTAWWVKIDKRLTGGQKLLAEITEINGTSVMHRSKEVELLKSHGLPVSISVNGKVYRSRAEERGDYWFIYVPKAPATSGATGYGMLADGYTPSGGLEEITEREAATQAGGETKDNAPGQSLPESGEEELPSGRRP